MNSRRVRRRFWLEMVLAISTAALAVLTILVPDWVEQVFGIEPDAGSGWFEVALTVGLAALTVAISLAARLEWTRSARRPV